VSVERIGSGSAEDPNESGKGPDTDKGQPQPDQNPPPDRPGQLAAPSRAESRRVTMEAGQKDASTTAQESSGQHTDRKTDLPSGLSQQSRSDGDFGDLAGEFEARAKSREQAKTSGSQLEQSKPDDELQGLDFKVDDKSLREHVDPEAGDANAAGTAEPEPEPAGDRTATAFEEGESDDRRRMEKFRGALHKNADDIVGKSQESADNLDSIFGPRPTGHAETRADSGPMATETHHSGVDAGNIVSTGLALGIVGAELFRRGREKIRGRDSQ
jgi:hypothetical protein